MPEGKMSSRLLRWLAPISALGLAGFLIARVSSCEPPVEKAGEPPTQKAGAPPAPEVAAPEPKPTEAPTLGQYKSLEFLGATKASPPVINDSLGLHNQEPAVEPAQQGSEP